MSDPVAGTARAKVGCGKRNLRQTRNPRKPRGFFIFGKYFRFGVALSENETYDPDVASVKRQTTNEGERR
jgi:hypothetical protein